MRRRFMAALLFPAIMTCILLTGCSRSPSAPARSDIQTVALKAGDRLFLTGGYDHEPKWLQGSKGFAGTLERFIPGQNDQPAAVVRTDAMVSDGEASGKILVLELRYIGAEWASSAIVHDRARGTQLNC